MISDIIKKNRSYRRFDEQIEISEKKILGWLENVRFTASAANLQPLQYKIITAKKEREAVFSCLHWAGYLPDWNGPIEGERPTAYLLQMTTQQKNNFIQYDAGIQAQTLLLQAVENEFGGCLFASIKREKLRALFSLNESLQIVTIIALGKPIEVVKIENHDNDVKYWRDEKQIHHVPKKTLKSIIIT